MRSIPFALCLLALPACHTDEPAMQVDAGFAEDAGGIIQHNCDFSRELHCGDSTCIAPARWCDGVDDCANRSDETNCQLSCGSGQVICTNGDCIAPSEVCDGTPHCGDGSDERNCPEGLCPGLPASVRGYGGQRLFTREQLSRCDALCRGDDDCYNERNCPGISDFRACVRDDSLACSAGRGGACRIDYESYPCCAGERCGGSDSCAQQACDFEAKVLEVCMTRDGGCTSSATELCLAP